MRILLSIVFFFLIGLSIAGPFSPIAESKQQNKIVVFTATWCASCREVIPVLEGLGSQNRLSVLMVDVDDQNAPHIADDLNLTIPRKELPQAFLVQGEKATLLFDGSNYRIGQRHIVRREMKKTLGNHL